MQPAANPPSDVLILAKPPDSSIIPAASGANGWLIDRGDGVPLWVPTGIGLAQDVANGWLARVDQIVSYQAIPDSPGERATGYFPGYAVYYRTGLTGVVKSTAVVPPVGPPTDVPPGSTTITGTVIEQKQDPFGEYWQLTVIGADGNHVFQVASSPVLSGVKQGSKMTLVLVPPAGANTIWTLFAAY